jgi:hypothetical protein
MPNKSAILKIFLTLYLFVGYANLFQEKGIEYVCQWGCIWTGLCLDFCCDRPRAY